MMFVVTGTCRAADTPSNKADTSSDTVEVTKDQWDQFAPSRDEKFDWIQLSSNEWLKGKIISLYNYKFEFDSDKVGLLKLDWKDIRQIRSAGPMSLQIETDNGQTKIVIGVLQLKENIAVILVNEQLTIFKRGQVFSIAKGTGKESDLWLGKLSFGANIRRGNSDSTDANLSFDAKRRTSDSRFSINYVGNFSRSQDVDTANNHRLNSFFDVFYNSKFFWRTYQAEYYRDTFKNIDQQLSLGSLFGYHFIRTAKTEWEISGGLGVLYKRFVSVAVGQEIDNTSPFLELGTKVDTELTNWMDYLFDFKFQLLDKDAGAYTHHLITTLSSDLTGDLDLDVSLVWDRTEDPQPEADGSVPDKDDFQMIVSISYKF